ncbi:MAG: glycoside hydrolase family 3 C-terminal domain-containing protein [Bacteroidales bacterium]|nr:glycoside hydrolase family 3 C-terminal domain-containing protein [Bacteroidales bacterium]
MKRLTVLLAALSAAVLSFAQTPSLPYQDASLSPSERAKDLLGRLSVEQKIMLMDYDSPEIPEFGIRKYNWWNEALHGSARNGLATVFPQSIGMAASWNDELLEQVFDVASTEQRIKFNIARDGDGARRYHGLTVWTPNINIFRDPRWGRGQETYGEDPYLTTVMGRAVVNGLQGDPDADYDKLHACLKHFAIHSGPEYERHVFNVEEVSWRDLNETYLYAFERLVKTTDVKEVMCAYNAYEGKPCCGSDKLLIKILREQWGFDGLVVTDCWAVNDFFREGHHNIFPNDPASATAFSVRSGADLECGDSFFTLMDAYKDGKVTEADLDRAVLRILKARFELGEMEPDENVSWHSIPSELLACDEHHALALKMARETMTLLQNRNNVLPLKKEARYAVVGPNAADSLVMWGNYNGIPRKTTTVLEGVIAKVGTENVVYAPGCDIAAKATDEGRYSETEGNYHDEALSRESGVSETGAVDLSMFNDVDAIIFVGGLSPKLEGEEMRVNFKGFKGGDRTSIELPETQRAYVRELQKTGKPIIFVHLSGSAVALAPEAEICDAILQGWYAGQAGGEAVADVLFGDYNPAGRLPVTFYASDADLPDFGDYDMPGHTYRYFKGKPLFPFGHGLSFSKFKYRRARLTDGVLRIKVKNRGKMDGDEVVQVYVKKADDVDGPVMSLRGFKRVHVNAGKKAVVEIPLSAENIDLFNPETGKMEAASGKYIVYYGGTSDITKLRKLKMTI